MQKINAYEFKDLNSTTQNRVRENLLQLKVRLEINDLENHLQEGRVTKEEFYKELGCSESYAESTPWFVDSCYYDKHEERLNRETEKELEIGLYTSYGSYIQERE